VTGTETTPLAGGEPEGRPPGIVGTRIFALFATERNWLALSRPHLPLAAPVVGTVGWQAFVALAPAAECGIVAVPPAHGAAMREPLRRFHRTHPFTPIVLVADGDLPPDVAALGVVVRAPLEAVRLWPAIQQACTDTLLLESAARFAAAERHPPLLRRALALACTAAAPIRTLGELARATGCDQRTFREHWRRADPLARTLRLEDVLDWLLLLRACRGRSPRTSWGAVAATLGVQREELRRIAVTHAGVRLRDLAPDTGPRLRALFRQTVLDPFVASDSAVPGR
jgi:hypothetical protein